MTCPSIQEHITNAQLYALTSADTFTHIQTPTGCILQELIASGARRRGVFAVGGVNGFKNEQLDATVNFLEPLEYLHSNMSNLVAHVWHSMKDDMATMPDEV